MRDTYVRVQKILPPKARDEMTDEEFDAVCAAYDALVDEEDKD